MVDPGTVVSAISATKQAASTLATLAKGNKGTKRTLLFELNENLGLLKLWLETDSEPSEIALKLQDTAFRKADAEGFNFNSLKRSKVSSASIREVPHLQSFIGKSTEEVFGNVYSNIVGLKHAASLKTAKKMIRLDIRLHNLRRKIVMLAIHLK